MMLKGEKGNILILFLILASLPLLAFVYSNPGRMKYDIVVRDGNSITIINTGYNYVGDLINSFKKDLNLEDAKFFSYPGASSLLANNSEIKIYRITSNEFTTKDVKEAKVRYINSRAIAQGRNIRINSGSPQVIETLRGLVKIGDKYIEQEIASMNLNSSRRSVLYLRGIGNQQMPEQREFNMLATAYYPGYHSTYPYTDGFTAIGLVAGYGIAAVDPRVIPLGTLLYVEGYGYAIAADVGGAIKGNRIDLCFDTYKQAMEYGVKRANVYILN